MLNSLKSYWSYHRNKTEKSYSNIWWNLSIINKQQIIAKTNPSTAEIRMLKHELTKEPCDEVIILKGSDTVSKSTIIDLLEDFGFNSGLAAGAKHFADINATVNIGGFIIPGWRNLVRLLMRFNPWFGILLKYKFAPGVKRLHIRAFQESKNAWYLIAHIDHYNWFHPNISGALKSHNRHGMGDYKAGNEYFYQYLAKVVNYLNSDKQTFDADKELTTIFRKA